MTQIILGNFFYNNAMGKILDVLIDNYKNNGNDPMSTADMLDKTGLSTTWLKKNMDILEGRKIVNVDYVERLWKYYYLNPKSKATKYIVRFRDIISSIDYGITPKRKYCRREPIGPKEPVKKIGHRGRVNPKLQGEGTTPQPET